MRLWPFIFLCGGCFETVDEMKEAPQTHNASSVVNVSNYGWSQSGKLTTGDKNRSVSLQANFTTSQDYTVEFGLEPNPLSNDPIFAEALIQWSVEGATISRRVTVSNGTSVTGVGQAVHVVVKDNTSNVAGIGAPNAVEYGITIQVAPGTRGTDKQPPTLIASPSEYTVAPGGFTAVNIPQDAGAKSVFVTAWSGTVMAEGKVQVDHIISNTSFKTYDPRQYDWVPLTPGATQIGLTNNIAPGGANIFFSVTFGIDG